MPPTPPHVDEALTRKVSDLARLKLTDDEVRMFTAQLGAILAYVDQLGEINIDGVEPMVHPEGLTPFLRPDLVHEFDGQKILDAAPDVVSGGFKVPAILG